MMNILKATESYAAELFAAGVTFKQYMDSNCSKFMSDRYNDEVRQELISLEILARLKVGTVYGLYGRNYAYLGEKDGQHFVFSDTQELFGHDRDTVLALLGDAIPKGTMAFITA